MKEDDIVTRFGLEIAILHGLNVGNIELVNKLIVELDRLTDSDIEDDNKQTDAREVQAFVQLCAGAASFQKQVLPDWVNSETRIFITEHDRLRVPLPVEVNHVWYVEEYEVPVCEPLPIEDIELRTWAWQWFSAPDGRRVYKLSIGFGQESNTIAFQQPPDYRLLFI